MGTATIAQCIRVTAALVGLAVATALDAADQFADRIDPPPLDYAGFDTRLDGLTPSGAQAKLDEAPGYRTEWRQDEAGCWVVKQ